MKWQKLLLFLAGSGAALGYVADGRPAFGEFWQSIISTLFLPGSGLPLPAGVLDPATRWTVSAVLLIDLLYVLWLRRQRRLRTHHTFACAPLSSLRCLNARSYEDALRQRHDALLARYQDPELVQFLLNREAARAQRLEQWVEGHDELSFKERIEVATVQKSSEPEAQWCVEGSALALLVEPAGA